MDAEVLLKLHQSHLREPAAGAPGGRNLCIDKCSNLASVTLLQGIREVRWVHLWVQQPDLRDPAVGAADGRKAWHSTVDSLTSLTFLQGSGSWREYIQGAAASSR